MNMKIPSAKRRPFCPGGRWVKKSMPIVTQSYDVIIIVARSVVQLISRYCRIYTSLNSGAIGFAYQGIEFNGKIVETFHFSSTKFRFKLSPVICPGGDEIVRTCGSCYSTTQEVQSRVKTDYHKLGVLHREMIIMMFFVCLLVCYLFIYSFIH